MKPIINPYAALAIGVITVSASAIFVKLSHSPSGVIAFYRLFFSVLFMLPLFLAKYTKELQRITKRDWLFTTISGVLLAFHFILWFESLNYTSVASSTVLVTLQPLFAFIGAYFFFKEKITVGAIISGIIAIIGSFIISWGDFQISGMALLGDILALIACAFITGYLLFGQTVRQRLSLITYTFLVYSISTITLFMYIVFKGEPLMPEVKLDWLYFILLAIFPTLLGHSLFNWVVKWLSTTTISMAILLEPVGATIMAYYILNETVTWSQIVGGIVVIFGLSLFIIDERKLRLKNPSSPL
ncbi:DMT family transporter [Bacillus sp. EB01]|uniref:DMT family transporter n=1 Tax=Bacillus sp. EB01 TaxID=1347086 RepID=UPI0005C7107E|nr:DMT family transporter [Bacillus sp. EB01]